MVRHGVGNSTKYIWKCEAVCMNASIAEIILENDRNDYRFESFCCAICSKEHGVEFLPTSQTWDRGRDGRTGTQSRKSHRNLLCATQSHEVDAKVEADLLRITATSTPEHLIYCSSQRLSENRIDDITKIVKRHVPSGSLTVYGAIQIGHLAEKYSAVFEKFYHAEIDSIRTAFERNPEEDESRTGLRLALITVGAEGAANLRETILLRSALEVLAQQGATNAAGIAKQISEDLGLPRALSPAGINDILIDEIKKGRVKSSQEEFELTESGREHLKHLPTAATEFLLQGRTVVREKIENLIGFTLAEVQFEQMWSTLLDFLSGLFYQSGLTVIRAINTFLGEDSASAGQNLRELIDEGCRRAAVVAASTPDSQILLETAIRDTLIERDGPAFNWLTSVCERFVVLCCLGLEATTGEQIKKTLISNRLVLDSDIVLTYLCRFGLEHAAVSDLLNRWLELGGKILLAPVVMEEVAYHAWISENDFRETRYLFGKLRSEERSRYIRNAFVSAFHGTTTVLSQWDLFIDQFKGDSAGDYHKIQNRLRMRLRAEVLPDAYDENLSAEITDYLIRRDNETDLSGLDEDAQYKKTRDGRLLASLAAARSSSAGLPEYSNFLLLSSSRALRKAERKFSDRLGGEPKIVLNRASLAYLLSLVPGVKLGADSLRRALFDFGIRAKFPDDEHRALRIIRGAEAHDLHWAERDLLQAQLNKSIQIEAGKRGIREESLRQQFIAGTDPNLSAELVSNALQSLAKDTITERQLQEAKNKIKRLEEQLHLTQTASGAISKKS